VEVSLVSDERAMTGGRVGDREEVCTRVVVSPSRERTTAIKDGEMVIDDDRHNCGSENPHINPPRDREIPHRRPV
jgi:hypothetical protein